MRAYHASEADIATARREWEAAYGAMHPEERGFIFVCPENRDAWRVFWLLRTQWEFPGMGGGRCAVSFADLEIALRRAGVDDPDRVFGEVHLMIAVARNVLLEQLSSRRRG